MINEYLNRVLQPTLKKYKVPVEKINIVKEDIALRLNSILAFWNEPVKKNAVLSLGKEEAEFYLPRTSDIEVRAFVVVGVRNSLLEDLHCDQEVHDGVLDDGYINDKSMKIITKEAISFFVNMDFQEESKKVNISINIFEELAKKYPAAWKMLEQLGQLETEKYNQFEAIKTNDLINNELTKILDTKFYKDMTVQSGICPLIRKDLYEFLQVQEKSMYVDSFKLLSRNPRKLMLVLEYLCARDCAFLTANYFLSNGYVSKADKILKPSHMSHETKLKFLSRLQTKDVSSRHLEYLNMHDVV